MLVKQGNSINGARKINNIVEIFNRMNMGANQGRTGPAVHRARTGAPLPKIGILRPYCPYIAPLLTKLLLLSNGFINIRHRTKLQAHYQIKCSTKTLLDLIDFKNQQIQNQNLSLKDS